MFLRGAARQGYQQVLVREALAGEPVGRFMSQDPVTVPPDLTLDRLVEDYIYKYHHKMYPVAGNGRLEGCITTREVRQVPREEWSRRTVRDAVAQCSLENTVRPNEDALNALARMTRSGNSRLLVVEGGSLLGVVTLKDLMRFLSLKLELEPGGPAPSDELSDR
jgi:CBS domain-containing protein